MSAVELARFGHAFRFGAENPVLTSASLDFMFERPPADSSPQVWYGAGWLVRTVTNGQTRWHSGSVNGSHALVVSQSDGRTWAVVMNGRPRNDVDAFDLDVDIGMGRAAGAARDWPGHDLVTACGLS